MVGELGIIHKKVQAHLSIILWGLEKGLKIAFVKWTYLAAACSPQALIMWTEIETVRVARAPSAVLRLRRYLMPTSSKPEE